MIKNELNQEQKQVLELLESRCQKVVEDDKDFRCLLEDQKYIEVTFFNEKQLCVSYFDKRVEFECEEIMFNEKFDKSTLDRLFEIVEEDTNKRLDYLVNKEYVKKIKEFLKS